MASAALAKRSPTVVLFRICTAPHGDPASNRSIRFATATFFKMGTALAISPLLLATAAVAMPAALTRATLDATGAAAARTGERQVPPCCNNCCCCCGGGASLSAALGPVKKVLAATPH
jgi:hypothetical protein